MTTRIACLSLLACLVLCGQAQAVQTLVPFTRASEAPLTDGARWTVIAVDGGMLVVDERDAAQAPQLVQLATPCGAQFGQPRAVAGGLVLIECSFVLNQTRPRLLVYDLRAGTFAEVEGTEILYRGSDGFTLDGVGHTWVSFNLTGHRGGGFPGLLNWHTGQVAPAPAITTSRTADLDAPPGTRRLCAAIRRPSTRRRLFVSRPPFAVSERAAGARRRLVLERCDGRARTLLTTARGLQGVSLGSHAVAWVHVRTIHARALRTGRERSWHSPLGLPVLSVSAVGPHVLVAVQGGPLGAGGFTVYRGRLP